MALPQSIASTPATRGDLPAEAAAHTLREVIGSCATISHSFSVVSSLTKGCAQVLRDNKILQLLIARVRSEAECLEMMASVPHQTAVSSIERSSS